MANEFIARNGLIAQESSVVTGSLIVTQGITGSLQGTASYSTYPYVLQTVAANTNAGSLPSTDYVYLVNGAYTVTLPNAIGNTSRYDIKNIGTGTVQIATTSTQTIEGGAAPISLPVKYTAVTLVSDNANWHLI